jgi:perosamine synthetase
MIPVSEPLVGEKEIEYVNECLRTGWISSAGHFIEEFEQKWADYCGMKYGIAMSNGTAALQAAIGCINLQKGDKVIMPSFTIISCAQAILYNGGIPVLVDCDPRTWCMDVEEVREKIESEINRGDGKLKAIMPVHIYGHPVNMDPILALAKKYNLKIIEDAAEVHGAEYLTGRNTAHPRWKKCGGFGDISVFSFYANKLITTGEGGMVLTNDIAHAEKARGLRNLCFRPEQRFLHTELGHNFRITNLQAAIGLGQLERIDEIVATKRRMGKAYTEPWKKHGPDKFTGCTALFSMKPREWMPCDSQNSSGEKAWKPVPSFWVCTSSPFFTIWDFSGMNTTPSPNASPVRDSTCHRD